MLKQVTKAVLAKAGYEMIRIRKGYPIIRDYGVNPDARYGEGKPAHRELQSLIGQRDDTYLETLRELAKFTEHLKKIPETADAGAMAEPHWTNNYFRRWTPLRSMACSACETHPGISKLAPAIPPCSPPAPSPISPSPPT